MSKKKLPPPLEVTERETEKKFEEGVSADYVAERYSQFLRMYSSWNMRLPILGGRKPLEFWNDCVRDYAVLAAEDSDSNDPVEAYQSTVTRNKTDQVCANLESKFFYPSVIAQNNEQAVDRTLGKIGDASLYWAYKQDGYPSESGQQKNVRAIRKAAIEGTAYTLDLVDDEGLCSELVPNEEIYFPNLWQPNLELQSRIYRAKLNMSVGEAEEAFGDYDAWKDVDTEGGWTSMLNIQQPELKGIFDGIVQSDKVSVLYVWERATREELKKLKAKRKVGPKAKRAWFYNVIVNNVAMFPVDNVSPYKSGMLPIHKLIFEPMAKPEFALGNSIPNKCAEDKRWKDAWKTNLRFRGKLAAMPPHLVIGGHLDGDEVMLPATFTSLPKDVDVKAMPGVVGVTQADINLMNMADEEISESSIQPMPQGRMTARTAMIQQQQAQMMMEPFVQQLAFFAASRSFHILTALFQYLPKGKLAKLVVPDQTLDDGMTGTFEVVFKETEDVLTSEVDSKEVQDTMEKMHAAGVEAQPQDVRRLVHSFKTKDLGEQSRKNGEPTDRVYVSPSYLQDIKWFLFADAADGMQDKDAMAQMKFEKDMPLMLMHPEAIVPTEVWRELIRMRGYNARLLQKGNPQGQQPPQQPGQPGQPGQAPPPPPSGLTPQVSPPNEIANAAALQTTGAPIGRLPGV